MQLEGRRILLGVSGGIAAFKSAFVARELIRRGADVRVVMTRHATKFVGPMTFTGLTGNAPVVDMWDERYAGEVHVELGTWAEVAVVVPATMHVLGRIANGLTDDALLASLACTRAPVVLAPAMHTTMWEHPATRRNVEWLAEHGYVFAGPVCGPLADGTDGMGRMAEPIEIVDAVVEVLRTQHDLAGVHVVVTAGPTFEDIDPVRYVGNRSSGKMGFAIAERARARGARVTLVHGPVALAAPAGVTSLAVRSALHMHERVTELTQDADVLVMAAAVADYRPKERSETKRKRSTETLTLELVPNPDILADVGRGRTGKRPVLVGFAVETSDLLTHARRKLEDKRVDLVVANPAQTSFEGDDNEAVFVDRDGDTPLPKLPKKVLADRILDRVRLLLDG